MSTQLPRPSVNPQDRPAPRRKPRWFLGTFWAVVALLLFIVGIQGGPWWSWIFALASVGYSIYLYRGGRWGFWFF